VTNKIIQQCPLNPNYMTFEEWNGNFILLYGQEPIGQGTEDNWQDIAAQITSLPSFSAYPIQRPQSYETWQEWATDLTQAINGPTH
jgi:hypothetical protein